MSAPFVLLTAPEGDFYAYVLQCAAEGIERRRIGCLRHNPHPNSVGLSRWVRDFRPVAVLEINRALARQLDWPRDVPHLLWLQDHRFAGEDLTHDLGVSDHLYLIVHPQSFGVTLGQD